MEILFKFLRRNEKKLTSLSRKTVFDKVKRKSFLLHNRIKVEQKVENFLSLINVIFRKLRFWEIRRQTLSRPGDIITAFIKKCAKSYHTTRSINLSRQEVREIPLTSTFNYINELKRLISLLKWRTSWKNQPSIWKLCPSHMVHISSCTIHSWFFSAIQDSGS